MTAPVTLVMGSTLGVAASHSLLDTPEAIREALGHLPRGAEWVSPQRPAVLVSLGPNLLKRVMISAVRYRNGEAIVEVVVRRNHEFPHPFQQPSSPLHLVQLDRPVERLRFVRYTEGTIYGQIVLGQDGRVRLLELPELGLLEDETYLIQRSAWAWKGSFRARVADAWVHEGNHLTHLEFKPFREREPVLRLLGPRVQEALRAHAGAAVAIRGLIQNATRRIVPWTVAPAFLHDDPLLFDASEEELAAA